MARSAFYKFVVGILIILVGWFGIWGFLNKRSELQASVNVVKSSIDEERAAIAKIEEIKNLLEERQEEVAKLKIAIPPDRDIASLIAAMEEAVSINGLALTALDISEPNDTRVGPGTGNPETPLPYQRLNVRAELSGRYGAFQSFLEDVESSFPLIEPNVLTFQPPLIGAFSEINDLVDPVFDFVLTLETYYLD